VLPPGHAADGWQYQPALLANLLDYNETKTLYREEYDMQRKIRTSAILFATLMLALSALACQAGGIGNLFATPTPTPTNTPTVTPTPTITPSPTPTITPSPTLTPTPMPTGISVEEQPDGSTLFIDYDNKYRLVLGPDWAVIPTSKELLLRAMDRLARDNPNLAEAAEALKDVDPEVIRLIALNKDPKLFIQGSATNINITVIGEPILATMPLAFVTGALEESLKQNGATVLTEGINEVENSNGVEVMYIDIEQSINAGGVKTLAQRLLVFQANEKLIVVTITALKQSSAAAFEDVMTIGGTIQHIK
jgi:hypothetical protein